MPKYNVTIELDTISFTFDTDDHKEELAEAEVAPNDPDTIHDWVAGLDNPLEFFGYKDHVSVNGMIHVEEQPKKK